MLNWLNTKNVKVYVCNWKPRIRKKGPNSTKYDIKLFAHRYDKNIEK